MPIFLQIAAGWSILGREVRFISQEKYQANKYVSNNKSFTTSTQRAFSTIQTELDEIAIFSNKNHL